MNTVRTYQNSSSELNCRQAQEEWGSRDSKQKYQDNFTKDDRNLPGLTREAPIFFARLSKFCSLGDTIFFGR